MKQFLFFIGLILWLSSTKMTAQVSGTANYLVKYEVSFALDSTDTENRSHEIHFLYAGSSTSYYASQGTIYRDSIFKSIQTHAGGDWRAMRGRMRSAFENAPSSDFSPQVYKNLTENEIWVASRIMRDQYIYQETGTPLQWEITGESKTIGDYEAQKALTRFGGRDWTAWFTLQVPITNGPYVFDGLPGLILELSDARGDYEFDVTSIRPLREPYNFDAKDNNYQAVSKDKFIQAYKANRENPLGSFGSRMRNSNFSFTDPRTGRETTGDEMARRMREEAAKRNNYIELF